MGGTVLVTGGAGYVGSHIAVELARAGYALVILDSLVNSSPAVLPALRRLTKQPMPLVTADVRDHAALKALFSEHAIDAVVHCAGLKAVGEGEARPLTYYDNNVGGAIALVEAMAAAGVKSLVFSSSATVYGQPDTNPVAEDAPLRPASVYGRTKRIVELLLQDIARADADWRIALLRYFNPAGAHPSGEIGEAPSSAPENLVPILAEVAAGRRPRIEIFGDDYPTADGTGVRDYIHVVDLAGATWRHLPSRAPARRNHAQPRPTAAARCSRSSRRSSGPAESRCRAASQRGEPATSRPITRIRREPMHCWAGARGAISTRSAPTRGAGRCAAEANRQSPHHRMRSVTSNGL
jgi:UDP-glucose 4-epimerase